MVAVRPDLASQSLSAWSRACEVKPPAAAPHRMSQVGTSLSETVHSAGLPGVGGATGAAGTVGNGSISGTQPVRCFARRMHLKAMVQGTSTGHDQVPIELAP